MVVTPRPFFQKGQYWINELRNAGHEVVVNDLGRRFTREELVSELSDSDAIISGNDPLDAKILECAPRLKVIAKYGVGLDNIDVCFCEQHGIEVMKALGANSTSVAEDTVLLMLAALRRFYELASNGKAGCNERVTGHEAAGKTIGIVGVGAIGCLVARIAHSLGMCVLGYDPKITPESVPEDVRLVGRDELLARSNVVSLHLPLLPSTERLVNKDFLSQMRDGAILVNTARAGLVDTESLFCALKDGKLAFAAEDVELAERPARLLALENYLITPHAASFTLEADEKTMAACVRNVRSVIG